MIPQKLEVSTLVSSTLGYGHETHCLKSRIDLCKVSLAPPILVGQARKPVIDDPASQTMYGNLNIKKTWVTSCEYS